MNNQHCQEQEPNPFEQSFSTVSTKAPFYDPYQAKITCHPQNGIEKWVSDISTYAYDSGSVNDSYSSVSDTQVTSEDSSSDDVLNRRQQQQQQYVFEPTRQFSAHNKQQQQCQHTKSANNKKRSKSTKLPEDEEKRKNFLERNRLAALKCRQRKKQWLSNLQARVEFLTNDNEQLQLEANALRNEIMDLKTLLITHKECPQYNAALLQRAQHVPMLDENAQLPYPFEYHSHVYYHNLSSSTA